MKFVLVVLLFLSLACVQKAIALPSASGYGGWQHYKVVWEERNFAGMVALNKREFKEAQDSFTAAIAAAEAVHYDRSVAGDIAESNFHLAGAYAGQGKYLECVSAFFLQAIHLLYASGFWVIVISAFSLPTTAMILLYMAQRKFCRPAAIIDQQS